MLLPSEVERSGENQPSPSQSVMRDVTYMYDQQAKYYTSGGGEVSNKDLTSKRTPYSNIY